ncbi:hypothetical protein [Methylicorpusculum sp.]|uniref:hypothetical protein n=1 Tax=Methylicorpusculum sp. TaxID=2713644 RepID=UPI0027174FAD|nr:hypothetical protein [Methylicorpusculum sp.]MDO8844416.1 hypothetical protein [Methylicorpusculum sp.]
MAQSSVSDHSLIPHSSGDLVSGSTGSHPILSRMTDGVLETIKEKNRALQAARFILGAYEFREVDYQQILRWAQALGPGVGHDARSGVGGVGDKSKKNSLPNVH